MNSSRAPRLKPVLGWIIVPVLLVLFFLFVRIAADRNQTLDIAATKPYWTANITGTTGDVAQVWIWTPGPKLLTNLLVPAQVRLARSEVLIQVRSSRNLAMNLDVSGSHNGSAHVSLVGGETNSAEFVSTIGRIPFLPLGLFSAAVLPPASPLGLYPVYDRPWSWTFSRYDLVTNLALVR